MTTRMRFGSRLGLFATVAALAAVASCGSSGETAQTNDSAASGSGGAAAGSGGSGGAGGASSGNGGAAGIAGAGGSAGTGGAGGDSAGSGGGDGVGGGGSGGDAGSAGAGGGDVTPGDPISAPDGVWTYVPFPDAYCRDGSPAHMMVHLNSKSKKVALYEEGGGACFNDASCAFLSIDLPSYVLGGGIFNFTRPDNPLRDHNIFYVPYCTGDVHAGDNTTTVGPVVGKQHFSGYSNLRLYLARVLATVPDATDFVLTGSSAGGFGAGLTADLVARNLPASVERVTMLDDSGPPMSSTYLPTCLQDRWQSVWGFPGTFLKDCGAACPTPSSFTGDYVRFLVQKYAKGPNAPKFMAGLISATSDSVISTFFGFGANNCTATTPVPLSPMVFQSGLLDIRTTLTGQTDRFGTFFYTSTQHTTLLADIGTGVLGGLYDTTAGGVKLTDWIQDLLDHKQAPHVGP